VTDGVLLREVRCAAPDHGEYPFSVPTVRALDTLPFPTPVTFFVGENGSGKSTLLEGIAAAAKLPTVGSDDVARDDTLAAARRLGRALRLAWTARTHRGFFLRAEDFAGWQRQVARRRAELLEELAGVGAAYADRSAKARELKEGPLRSSLHEMERRYGVDPDARSHGQAFLNLFEQRVVPGGLHLLDEPEAALSPQSQLALLALIHRLVGEGAQFVIATHAPILLAYPGATIYSFDEAPPARVGYAALDHVNLTREFLSDPARYLRHLLVS
jgi:predicted ATPase